MSPEGTPGLFRQAQDRRVCRIPGMAAGGVGVGGEGVNGSFLKRRSNNQNALDTTEACVATYESDQLLPVNAAFRKAKVCYEASREPIYCSIPSRLIFLPQPLPTWDSSLVLSVSLNLLSRLCFQSPIGTITASWNILNCLRFVKCRHRSHASRNLFGHFPG